MKLTTRYLPYFLNEIERSFSAATTTKRPSWGQKLLQLRQIWLSTITHRNQVRIWQLSPGTGNSNWNVYDPLTNKIYGFDTEAEVRIWLEQRYYQ